MNVGLDQSNKWNLMIDIEKMLFEEQEDLKEVSKFKYVNTTSLDIPNSKRKRIQHSENWDDNATEVNLQRIL